MKKLIILLGFLNALTPFTIDLYLPAFAEIASDLQTTVSQVSLSVAVYFVGFALGQIIYGPLLDRFGRKPPLLFGLGLYCVASLGCYLAQSVEVLWVFRFLTAIGGAAAAVGTMTMVRDFFEPKESARVFSMLMLVLSVSPLIAPSVGAVVTAHFGWRNIFAILAVISLIDIGIVLFALPITYVPDRSKIISFPAIFKTFMEVFKVRQFRTYTIAGALSFSGLFVFITAAASIYINDFGVTKQMFGLIFALLAGGMIAGGQINNLLMKKYDSMFIFKNVLIFQVMAALIFSIGLATNTFGIVTTTIFLFLLLTSSGIGFPNAAALALAPFTKDVGSASSLMGFLQMGLGALAAGATGFLHFPGALPTASVMFVACLIGLFMVLRHARSLKSI